MEDRPWKARVFAFALFWFLLAPVLPIIVQSFLDKALYDKSAAFTLDNFSRLLADKDFGPALVNTLWFSVIATALSVALGLAFTLALERTELPFRRTLRTLVLSPIFISPLILAFAWSMLYGPGGYFTTFLRFQTGIGLPNLNSFGGMCLIAGIVQSPVSYLYLSGAVANIPATLEKSAYCSGASPWLSLTSIVLPLLKPAILYCTLLNLMLVVDLLGVPLIIGEPAGVLVLSTFLYTKGAISARMDYGLIAAAAVLTIVVVQALIWLQGRWIGDKRRYATVGPRGFSDQRVTLGSSRWVISAGLLLFSIVFVIVPTMFLVLRSFTTILTPLLPIADVLTLDNYKAILQFEQYRRSIWNSILISAFGGAFAVAITLIAVVFAYRSTPGIKAFIEQLAMVPRAIPGLVVGIGFFYGVILVPGGDLLRNTLLILAIAFTIRNFPSGFGSLAPAFNQVGVELDRAARASGSGPWRAVFDVTLPLMKGAIIGCFALYFINFFKEYSTAAFLFGPGTEIIGTTMLQLNYTGYLGTLAALSVIELAILIPVMILLYGRR